MREPSETIGDAFPMTTTYALYLESGPQRRKTMAHALDLLGCVALGPTTEAALDDTPDAIRAYLRFLRRHGASDAQDPSVPFTTQVVEHITSGSWLGNGSPYLIFAPDLIPLTDAELETCLRRCDWLCDDLAAWADARTPAQLEASPATGGRVSRAVLLHALAAQGAALATALGSAPGFNALARAVERGERNISEALVASAAMVAERVGRLTPAQRSAVRTLPSGQYTLRKALRRILEHNWEHLLELERRA
jgi:predicted RNase H-like HicB family nuclease